MKQIDLFIDSVYQKASGSKKEIQELKDEMRSHLVESVHELKMEGKTEEEAVKISIERFGGETVLFEEKEKPSKKKMSKRSFVSLLLFSLSVLLITTISAVDKINEQKRQFLYNSIEGILYSEKSPNAQSLEKEITLAIEKGVIKNIVITKEENSSSAVVFKTIDEEGFAQDDSFLVETKEEWISTIEPSKENTYLVVSSYNVIKYEPIIILVVFLSLTSLILYFYKRKK